MPSGSDEPLRGSRIQRLSRFWGRLVLLGIVFLIVVILSLIKVTPFAVYQNPKFGIQIKYPDYWRILEYPEGVEAIVFISPPEDEDDQFFENVNITKKPVPPNKRRMEYFTEDAIRQLRGVFDENIEILQSRSMSIAERPGHILIFKGTSPEPVKYMHAWFISGDTAYIITYTAMERDFDHYFRDALDMVKSVRLL